MSVFRNFMKWSGLWDLWMFLCIAAIQQMGDETWEELRKELKKVP